jgi:hypothetical protein
MKHSTSPIPLVLALVGCLSILLSAQDAPISSGMGNEDTGAPKLGLQEPLPGEKLIDRLKLDGKSQAPEVRLLLMDASRDAMSPAQRMLEIRQRLVNLALQNKSDEMAAAVDAYAAAAADMAAIEARTFAKIYAMLKPNQQSGSVTAFAVMAGMFQPPAPRGGRRAQGGAGR